MTDIWANSQVAIRGTTVMPVTWINLSTVISDKVTHTSQRSKSKHSLTKNNDQTSLIFF